MIPLFEDFLYPFLLSLKDGKKTTKEIHQKMVEYFNLSASDCALMTKGGNKTQLADRINWCRQYFRRALFIEIPNRGVYQITQRGKEYLDNHSALCINDLMEYKEFADYAGPSHKTKGGTTSPTTPVSPKTPTEILEDAFTTINDSLRQDLLDMVMQKDSTFFEKLVVDLLVAMGYGGSFNDNALVTQPTKDGGIDGIIKEDKLGLDNIYIQAKRWKNNVDAPEIQKFSGALLTKNASKGVFITTSSFSKGAVDVAQKIQQNQKIILIDGEALTNYMIEYNVGVSVRKSYIVKRIDSDYFDDED